jgi:hypothetical protein
MSQCRSVRGWLSLGMLPLGLLWACGGGEGDALQREAPEGRHVAVADFGENMVWAWSRLIGPTLGFTPPVPPATPEEQRPQWALEHATVHAAMYDAAIAIAGTHRPLVVTPTAPIEGASQDAAVMAAAYGVLKGLFPSRSAVYQPPYDTMLAAIPDGVAKTRGLAVGASVAAGILAWRANDGRAVVLPLPVSGTQPGEYRDLNAPTPWFRLVRPYTLTSAAQFRADGPPALSSDTYADDVNETQDWGGTTSPLRTPEQTGAARFHSEPVNFYWTRNLRQFARSQPKLADNARLMAQLWVALADSAIGCFDAKWYYLRWRPVQAIRLADTDGNDRTNADPTWAEAVPTAPHPEYPASPACVAASVAETLSTFYGTRKVVFTFDSTVTASTQHYQSVDEMETEHKVPHLWAGTQFRTSLVHGAIMGAKTSRWVAKHHFTPQEQ